MEIKVTQCHLGHYNLLDSKQESLAFGMSISHDGKVVEENGVKAIIAYNGDPEDIDIFKDAFDNLDWVFEKCYKDGNKWISKGGENRRGAMLFAKLYTQYFLDINTLFREKKEQDIRKKLAALEHELKFIDDLPETIRETANACVLNELNEYTKWQNGKKKELEQTKEGTEKYASIEKDIANYQQKIDSLDALIILKATTLS